MHLFSERVRVVSYVQIGLAQNNGTHVFELVSPLAFGLR
jgi:hypothetical protein